MTLAQELELERSMRLACRPKTDHLCLAPGCEECTRNTETQMARNRVKFWMETQPR